MILKDEIQQLIEQITKKPPEVNEEIHRRWMGTTKDDDEVNKEYLPLIVKAFDRDNTDEYKSLWPGHLRYPLKERIEDNEKMLYEQLVQLVPLQRYASDAIPCVMPMFGNAFLLPALSLETEVFGDTMESARMLSRDEVLELKLVDDISESKYIKKTIEFIRYAKKILPEQIPLGLCFMMSPYDLAYLIRGSELMMDMYTNPEAVHYLMNICTELFIKSVKLLKEEIGEPDEYFRYGPRTYRGGNILCEDCCVMLSPSLHKEFSVPYTERALNEIGGGWVHFCGNGVHLLDNYFEISNMHGILYGQLGLNGVVEDTIKKHMDNSKALHYDIVKPDGEEWLDFFTRVYAMTKDNKYLDLSVSCFTDEGVGENLMEMWHSVQR